MSGRRRKPLSPSLFPFLAVLVCTLGTLILLLALVAQNAADAAVAQSNAAAEAELAKQAAAPELPQKPRPPHKPELPQKKEPISITAAAAVNLIEEEEYRLAKFVSFRDAQTAEVELKRDQIAHVEAHIEKITSELKRLSSEVENAVNPDDLDQVTEADLAAIQTQIEAEERSIEKIKTDGQSQRPRVVIVPHKGPNGTDRRPVYLECRKDELVIWPEKSTISIEQLALSKPSANPVEAALRVIRNEALQSYGDSAAPYPLLVVRPDGIETYGAARSAMMDYDDQFGYELVPAEVELALTAADPNLKKRVDRAIAKAVSSQSVQALAASIGRRSGGRKLPVLSAANMNRKGLESGYRSFDRNEQNLWTQQAGDASYAAKQYAQRNSRSAIGSGVSDGNAYGSGSSLGSARERKWNDDLKQAAKEIGGSSLESGGPLSGFSNSNLGNGSTSQVFAKPLDVQASQQGLGSASGGQFPNQSSAMSVSNPGQRNLDSTNVGSRNTGPYALPGEQGDAPEISMSDTTRELTSVPGQLGQYGQPGMQMPESNQYSGASGSSSASRAGRSSNQRSSQASDRSQAGSGSSSNHRSSQASGNQAAASQSSSNQSAGSQSASASQSNSHSQTPNDQLVQPGGAGWALPRQVASSRGISIVRTLRAQAYADQIVLLPSRREAATEVFGLLSSDSARPILELATAVRDRVDRWGVALPGGKWSPVLEVQIMPGGDGRFKQLSGAFQGSGVEVVRAGGER